MLGVLAAYLPYVPFSEWWYTRFLLPGLPALYLLLALRSVPDYPHASALHCGACGGYQGDVSARLLAGLLNDADARTAAAAHKLVNATLYRLEEAMACWRRITAPVARLAAGQAAVLDLGLDLSTGSRRSALRTIAA